MKLLYPIFTMIELVLMFQMQQVLGFPKFKIWKEQAIEKLAVECQQKPDVFYGSKCAALKSDLLSADVEVLDSIFQISLEKCNYEGRLQLEYYLRYNYSGEHNDIWDIFVFKKDKGFFVTKYSRYEEEFSINDVMKLNKAVFNSKNKDYKKNLLCNHSAILTKFCENVPKKTKVILCPHISYFDEVDHLTR